MGGGCRQFGGHGGQWEGVVGGTSRQWRGEVSVGGGVAVGGGVQWVEGGGGKQCGRLASDRVGQCEDSVVEGEWDSWRRVGKRRVIQWNEGEAMGHVVMFHPPN